uniref:Uncharacterized protein n=1 Tax=Opuntia streptacantha TaxID=393608 RepID=A0A7C9ESB3_OPUST
MLQFLMNTSFSFTTEELLRLYPAGTIRLRQGRSCSFRILNWGNKISLSVARSFVLSSPITCSSRHAPFIVISSSDGRPWATDSGKTNFKLPQSSTLILRSNERHVSEKEQLCSSS